MKKEISRTKINFNNKLENFEVFVGNQYSNEFLIPKNKKIIGKKIPKKIIINSKNNTAIVSSNVTLDQVNQKANKYKLHKKTLLSCGGKSWDTL